MEIIIYIIANLFLLALGIYFLWLSCEDDEEETNDSKPKKRN